MESEIASIETSAYQLCIMCKNESKNIYDTIKYVYDNQRIVPVRCVILDTGSTDNTIEWIRKISPEPTIYQSEFINFAASRNELLDHARALGNEAILMIDCDDRVEFDVAKVIDDACVPDGEPYCILIKHVFKFKDQSTIFYNVNIIADPDARYKYPMHETLFRDSVLIKACADAGHIFQNREEAIRMRNPRDDVDIIENWIENNPTEDHTRMLFYLARSYAAFDIDKAFEIFMKRIRCGGAHFEEIGWALFECGRICFYRENYEEAIILLEEAHKLFADEKYRGPYAESIPTILRYLSMSYGEKAFEIDLHNGDSNKLWKRMIKYKNLADVCPQPKNQIIVIDSHDV